MNLAAVAEEIQHRIIHIFSRDDAGRRAVNGGNPKLNRDPHFRDYVHFYEVSCLARAERMTNPSSSTETTVEVSVRRTSVDGPVSLLGASCRRENSAVSPRRQRVGLACVFKVDC